MSAASDPTVPMNVVAPEQPDGFRGYRRRFPHGRKAGGAAVPALLVAASILTVLAVVGIAQLLPSTAAGIVPSGTASAVSGNSATGPATTPAANSPVGATPAKAGGPGTATPRSSGSTKSAGTTKPPATTSAPSASPTDTGHYPAWRANHGYTVGDRVTYAGHDYQCLQAHTSQIGWEPPNTPALWQQLT